MGNGFQFIDIILFAMIAAFLARLAESGDESSAEAARLAATLDGLFLAGDGDDPRYNMVH